MNIKDPVIERGPRATQCAFWKKYMPQLLSTTGKNNFFGNVEANEIFAMKLIFNCVFQISQHEREYLSMFLQFLALLSFYFDLVISSVVLFFL